MLLEYSRSPSQLVTGLTVCQRSAQMAVVVTNLAIYGLRFPTVSTPGSTHSGATVLPTLTVAAGLPQLRGSRSQYVGIRTQIQHLAWASLCNEEVQRGRDAKQMFSE